MKVFMASLRFRTEIDHALDRICLNREASRDRHEDRGVIDDRAAAGSQWLV
jgi:hypothetical protein